MNERRGSLVTRMGITVLLLVLAVGAATVRAQSSAPTRAVEQHEMRLVGHDDLQARSAYQPVIHKQGVRWVAYIGHHGGQRPNPLTGKAEWSGTSVVDVTDPRAPRYLAHIPGASGQAELVFIAYFNAGVRAVDVRDPFNPKEVAFYIPATTSHTDKRCVTVGGTARCQVAVQTNNVEVDDRWFIYLVDRADTGLDIVELTGAARAIARLP